MNYQGEQCQPLFPFLKYFSYSKYRKTIKEIIPARTVANKLRVLIAIKNVGMAARISTFPADKAIFPSAMKISWPTNAAITEMGIKLNHLVAHSGSSKRLSTISGRTLGMNVTSAVPKIINRMAPLTSIFPTPSLSLRQ